eukprot:gene37304-44713_t
MMMRTTVVGHVIPANRHSSAPLYLGQEELDWVSWEGLFTTDLLSKIDEMGSLPTTIT